MPVPPTPHRADGAPRQATRQAARQADVAAPSHDTELSPAPSPDPSVHRCAHRGLPRAGVDPIDTPDVARVLLEALAADPPRHETIAILLDDADRGVCVVSVDGTTDPDAVLDVAEMLVETSLRIDDIASVILASVRPGGADHVDDLERWAELSDRFDDGGLELIEWFVVGRATSTPRALLGAPPRWPT